MQQIYIHIISQFENFNTATYVFKVFIIISTYFFDIGSAAPVLKYSAAHLSVLTILAISFERLIAIVFPLKVQFTPSQNNRMGTTYAATRRRTLLTIACIWIVAVLSSAPFVLIAQLHDYESDSPYATGRDVEGPVKVVRAQRCLERMDDAAWKIPYLLGIVTIIFPTALRDFMRGLRVYWASCDQGIQGGPMVGGQFAGSPAGGADALYSGKLIILQPIKSSSAP